MQYAMTRKSDLRVVMAEKNAPLAAIAAASHWMTSRPDVTFEQTKLFRAFAEEVSWKEWIKKEEMMESADWVASIAIPDRKNAILDVIKRSGVTPTYDNLRKVMR